PASFLFGSCHGRVIPVGTQNRRRQNSANLRENCVQTRDRPCQRRCSRTTLSLTSTSSPSGVLARRGRDVSCSTSHAAGSTPSDSSTCCAVGNTTSGCQGT